MQLADRPPSTKWEQTQFAGMPGGYCWTWFKPPHAPQGLVVRVPPETFQAAAQGQPVTMRRILQTVGVDPRSVSVWYLYGSPYDAQQGANPLLDSPIPAPGAAADPTIAIFVHPAAAAVPAPAVAPAPLATSGGVFDRIAADWNSSLQLEYQLELARKHLYDTMGRINALNRDLTPEERLHGDRHDKSDWQEARRWLRDISARLAKLIKDHDIGLASESGQRNWFEATFQQVVVPRRMFDGIEQIQREFEAYRKTVQTLLMNMTNAQTTAIQDGERRAQEVLRRLAAKARAARTKR